MDDAEHHGSCQQGLFSSCMRSILASVMPTAVNMVDHPTKRSWSRVIIGGTVIPTGGDNGDRLTQLSLGSSHAVAAPLTSE